MRVSIRWNVIPCVVRQFYKIRGYRIFTSVRWDHHISCTLLRTIRCDRIFMRLSIRSNIVPCVVRQFYKISVYRIRNCARGSSQIGVRSISLPGQVGREPISQRDLPIMVRLNHSLDHSITCRDVIININASHIERRREITRGPHIPRGSRRPSVALEWMPKAGNGDVRR